MNIKRRALSFDDVLLVPQHSNIESRTSIDLSVDMHNISNLKTPIFSAPMDTVTEADMAISLAQKGGLGIVHRYNTPAEQQLIVGSVCEYFEDINTQGYKNIGVAVGVSGDYLMRAHLGYSSGARLICVDVAHGDHVLALNAVKSLRQKFGKTIHIMAGNVATLAGLNALADAGADSVRVGIGGGSICSTRIQTGHGVPTLQSVLDCARTDRDCLIIADGGLKTSGDIVKAIAAGADAVMLGSLLAGTSEAPGNTVFQDGRPFKTYRGMASVEAQIDWRGHAASEEGVSTVIPAKGPVTNILDGLVKGIRSGLSYSGSRNITEFQSKAEFVEITSSGMSESRTHILD